MKKDKVRICLVGAGAMANAVHYPNLAEMEDVEIAGLCDLLPDRVHATADKYHIPQERRYVSRFYDDYQKMIEKEQPDGVFVIGPPNIVYDIWIWCLQQGLSLYIEKPMGMSTHQAKCLAHLAEEKKLITQVSHQRRSCPLLIQMHEACLRHGAINYAVCEFYKHGPANHFCARDHMYDDFTHTVDTVRWMCGGEVVNVESTCRRVGTVDINWIAATLEFDNGSIGHAVSSWCSGRRVLRVQMHAPGVYADAEVEGKAYLYENGDYQGKVFTTQKAAGSSQVRVFGGFWNKQREFIESLKTGKEQTSSPFRDCVKTVQVCDMILGQAVLRGV